MQWIDIICTGQLKVYYFISEIHELWACTFLVHGLNTLNHWEASQLYILPSFLVFTVKAHVFIVLIFDIDKMSYLNTILHSHKNVHHWFAGFYNKTCFGGSSAASFGWEKVKPKTLIWYATWSLTKSILPWKLKILGLTEAFFWIIFRRDRLNTCP